jgi:hypothetical protein
LRKPYLSLGTPSLLRHKYKPTVWQFQRKEVTSMSDNDKCH